MITSIHHIFYCAIVSLHITRDRIVHKFFDNSVPWIGSNNILKIVKSNIFTEEMYFLNVSEKNAATKIF